MIPSISQGGARLFAANLENLFFCPNAAVGAIPHHRGSLFYKKGFFFWTKTDVFSYYH
ncbi:MAG: hypothetical protein K2F85_03630 [Helicobacter sp.]|nr:hypothetical protein [Helicobacter sp.]